MIQQRSKELFKTISILIVILFIFCLSSCDDSNVNFIFHSLNDEIYNAQTMDFENIDSLELPTPNKEGYIFEGWYMDKDYTISFDTKEVEEDADVVELYAKYKIKKYSITKNILYEQLIQEVEYDSKIDLGIPTKEGYTFEGWYIDEDYTKKFDYFYMPSKDITVYAKMNEMKSYTVTIKSNIDGALNFTGATLQVINSGNPNFASVEISSNLGYEFCYYEIDGVKYSSNVIEIEMINSNVEILAVADYATYELPIVNINTNDVAINSKTDYTDMSFSVENCDSELEEVTGGIRLRGNSTMGYAKKPYRIKFDKKQSLFGLEKAKSWVLLADYLDPSGLHNYTAFNLGLGADGLSFTPTPNKVNVYLNGEFVGLYTLCEQIQENEGRMNIEEDITEDMVHLKDFNFFICMDASVVSDSDAILDETYFYLEDYDRYIELKYPEKDAFVSEQQFALFFEELKEYVNYLFNIFATNDVEHIKEEVNMNSLVDYLMIDIIMGEHDHSYKSFNMYYTKSSNDLNESGKLNFGPIWDYDWSLNTPWTGIPNLNYDIDDSINYTNLFYQSVANVPEFYCLLMERYKNFGSMQLENIITELYWIEGDLKESFKLNAEKWYVFFDEKMTEENIKFLNKYLMRRKQQLDKLWIG